MNQTSELNYMGIDQDGKFVCVACPEMSKRELAFKLARWVREGLSIERCDDEFVRHKFGKNIREVRDE